MRHQSNGTRSFTPLIVAAVAAAALGACSKSPVEAPVVDRVADPVAAIASFETAVARARASDVTGAMAALRVALTADTDACQRALLEPAFHEGLRDTPEFRSAVHDAVIRHEISHLSLVSEREPGEWIEVEGRVVDPHDAPVPGAIVRVSATDTEGHYHPEIEGDRVPRLFATLIADAEGRFGFATVRPGPYPGTRNARHVHLFARHERMRMAAPGYAVFDDDPLLLEPQNAEQRGEAIRIRMRVVDGRPRGTLVLPMR